ncbi:sulfite exporter TauE/SafE family protein [Tabrizicola oligotrophica]|uniref:Probable membrane transporter protein n=1 Tax=Tabrizicola oligotrophica TaxID=2710650 RepID=A0A6M0QV77_9RHOB|nr:sulfite exporter TauE/SafE family protein [Tabrizicola oligotrophica]NEY90764.1 sulfite exporter TauE/SafE family protein [Tabrizicola oligotrophica]
MDGVLFWTCAIAAAALVGMGKGGMPVVGMLGVPVLSLAISPVTAAGLLLPVYVLSDMFGLYAYRHAFDRRVLAILMVGVTVGVGLGWATASITPEWLVTTIVGLIGAVFALRLLTRRGEVARREAEVAPGLFWGAVTGFTSFVSHSGAPPFQVYVLPLGLQKMVFAGTNTILFAYLNGIKLVPYWALGQFSPGNLKVAVLLMPAAAVAVFAGVKLVKIVPEKLFFQIITWALLGISLKLIWDGLSA